MLQVNGKVRARVELPAEAPREEIERLAVEHPNVRKFTDGKPLRKIIVVPGKLVNIVAN